MPQLDAAFAALADPTRRAILARAEEELERLWAREMPTGVYDPRWLRCHTVHGSVHALAFTLSRHSPNFTGDLDPQQLRDIFRNASGRYGTTLDYARQTYDSLQALGIEDRALRALLAHAPAASPDTPQA